jgi:curved DNA-binding protein CbpA
MSDTRAVGTAALLQHLEALDTGLLEIRDGKKKWRFHLASGAIVGAKSNLRSEQPDAVRESRADLSDAAVLRSAVIRQVRSVCRLDAPVVQFLKGVTVREPADIPTGSVLVKGAAAAWSEDKLSAGLRQVLEGFPQVSKDLDGYRLPRKVQELIGGLDGTSRGSDVIEEAVGRKAENLAGLWLVWKLGALRIRVTEARPEDEDAVEDLGFDLGAMIAEGLDSKVVETVEEPAIEEPAIEEPAIEEPAIEEPAIEEPAIEEPAIEALPMEALSDVAPEPAEEPSPKEEPPGMVLSGIRRGRRPVSPKPVAAKHPLQEKLESLHARVMAAENHFEVMGESWESEPAAFRAAHLKLAGELHPDRFSGAPSALQDLATEAFDKLRAAWEVLEDDAKRSAYIDQKIHGKKTEDELAMEQLQSYWAAEKEFKRGKAAFHQGRVLQAHERFKAAVDKVPDELEFRAFLGYTTYHLNKTKDRDAAAGGFEMLKEVLEINKEQERKLDEGWVLMGQIHRDEERPGAAKKAFMQALRFNPANGDAERELRRLHGGEPGKKKEEKAKPEAKKKRSWFGKKK